MSKDRILGSSAIIEIFLASGPMSLEVDSFSASQKHELKAWHPLGQIGERNQLIYKGWEMDIKIGKTDDSAAKFFDAIDMALLTGGAAPRARVTQTIKNYDGTNEIWFYPDTVLHGYKNDTGSSADEIKEDFKGAAQKRVKGY